MVRGLGLCIACAIVLAHAIADDITCSAKSCGSEGSAFIQRSAPMQQARVEPEDNLDLEANETGLLQQYASAQVTVVSYNLYWWNVKQNNRWGELWNRIRSEGPFDLIGFQECENVGDVLNNAGLSSFGRYQGPTPNPAPLAWNSQVFSKIGGPGNKWIASDRWGNRHLTWVRLRHNPSGANVFFANTHGPLGDCGNTVGANWLAGVNENKQGGDTVFVTGDFNCDSGTPAMRMLKGSLTVAVDGGIDQILSDKGRKVGGGKRQGSPSDHPLIKGSFTISGSGAVSNQPTGSSGQNSGGQSSGSCQDSNGQCSAWAGMGECARNPGYMNTNCKKSCNRCAQSQSSGATSPVWGQSSSNCQDSNGQCSAWAGMGECGRNPAYMNTNCKKSCNKC